MHVLHWSVAIVLSGKSITLFRRCNVNLSIVEMIEMAFPNDS